jgi:DNA-directed RNA polymerase specialized sigma24 family protein
MANHEAWAVGVHLDESYVEELFRARYLKMVRLAGLLGADDPEDIAQEAFTRLMIKEPDLGDRGASRQHSIPEPNHVRITPRRRPVRAAHAVPAAGAGPPDRDPATAVHLQARGELFLARRQQSGPLA